MYGAAVGAALSMAALYAGEYALTGSVQQAFTWLKDDARQQARTPQEATQFIHAVELTTQVFLGTAGLLMGGRILQATPVFVESLNPVSTSMRIRNLEALGLEVPLTKVHKNSLDYLGETHVYQILNGQAIMKIGESAQGLNKYGQSIRAESQVRKLQRTTGIAGYKSKIIANFGSKRDARVFETDTILKMRQDNPDALPLNKGNR